MKVRLLIPGDVAPHFGESLFAGLPQPLVPGEIVHQTVNSELCYDRQRAQTDAACLLEKVPLPDPGWSNIALFSVDLFMPALTYVFGLAALGSRRAVASWARLRPDGGSTDSQVLRRRLLVEVVHEIGHGMGLVHCPVPNCPMHRSMWAESVDLKDVEYCPSCLDSLLANVQLPGWREEGA